MDKVKKLFKFSGLCAAVIALVGWLLLMVTPILEYHDGDNYSLVKAGVFGGGQGLAHVVAGPYSGDVTGDLTNVNGDPAVAAWSVVIAWILILVAVLALIALFVLPLLKVNALDKLSGIIALVAAGLLIAAGILIFVSGGVYNHAQGEIGSGAYLYDDFKLGTGYVFAGILAILSGLVAAVAPVFGLIKK